MASVLITTPTYHAFAANYEPRLDPDWPQEPTDLPVNEVEPKWTFLVPLVGASF